MYAVIEGRVAVSIGGGVVERLGPGGVFGELALIEQTPRMASVVAETDCQLLPISRTAFLLLVKTNAEFAASLLGSLAERLRAADRAPEIAQRSTPASGSRPSPPSRRPSARR